MSEKDPELFCEVCHKQPFDDGVALIRTGLKGPGQDPHWRCPEHVETAIDPVIVKIKDILSKGQ